MGRPERPVDLESPLAEFAQGLRALRQRHDRITYREMSRRSGMGVAALSTAANGQKLPTLPLTLAFVNACDGSSEEWCRRWQETKYRLLAADKAGAGPEAASPFADDTSAGTDRDAEHLRRSGPSAGGGLRRHGSDWVLADLVQTDPHSADRPDEAAYSAMAFLISEAFLRASARERSRQVHHLTPCPDPCDLCSSITLRHVQWAVQKMHKHLQSGPPTTRGVPVRDWTVILDAVTAPAAGDIQLQEIRSGLLGKIPTDDPLLPLIMAFGTQFGLRGRGPGPRKMANSVNDYLTSVLSSHYGWAAKPRRDLRVRADLARACSHHPDGRELLDQVMMLLEHGVPDAFERVLEDNPSPAAVADLRGLVEELLRTPSTYDWFLANIERRSNYNNDQAITERQYPIPEPSQSPQPLTNSWRSH